jgi:hypothetical protein
LSIIGNVLQKNGFSDNKNVHEVGMPCNNFQKSHEEKPECPLASTYIKRIQLMPFLGDFKLLMSDLVRRMYE